jgi:glycosyltransferase involved in cell wall biosynthesis
MTILEAMSAKTAIVATSVGGIPEVIIDGQEGFLVEKSNPQALAAALKNYIEQPNLVKKHGNNAREKILSNFNEKHMVQAYLAQYQALIKGQ